MVADADKGRLFLNFRHMYIPCSKRYIWRI